MATPAGRPRAPGRALALAGSLALLVALAGVLVPAPASADPAVGSFSPSGPRLGKAGDAVLLDGPACRDGSPAAYCAKLLDAGNGKISELYDPVKNSWSGCAVGEAGCAGSADKPANLNLARNGAQLTLLDGPACRGAAPPDYCGKVLLVGGTSGGGMASEPYARVELYDPAQGNWRSCDSALSASAACPAPYPGGAVREHSATLLADGRVLVAGGTEGAVTIEGSRRDSYIYDPARGRWGPPGTLYNGRRDHRAVLLEGGSEECAENCGKVLLVGGEGSEGVPKTAELLDPTGRDAAAAVSTPPLVKSRAGGHSATLLPTGHVLVAGGGATGAFENRDSAEYFYPKAPATGSGWGASSASLRARRHGHSATLVPGGRLLLAGGDFIGTSNELTGAAELYDPYGGPSLFAAEGPKRPQSAALLPPGPLSVCGTSCGKVALSDAYSASEALGWLYTPQPELAALGPAGGPASGGTKVTLVGRGLASATSVRFGNLEATGLAPDPQSPDTKLVAQSPPHPGGTVPVTVTSSGGSSASTQATQFTYTAAGGSGGGTSGGGGGSAAAPTEPGPPRTSAAALAGERARARALRGCVARAGRKAKRALARRGSLRRGTRRQLRRRIRRLRGRCLRRHGRTPGPVTGLRVRALSETRLELSFLAPGSDGQRPPPARAYLVKQSTTAIRSAGGFRRAQSLCKGSCRFSVVRVGDRISLTVRDLSPRSTYYYAIAARDNVSRRLGPRSRVVRVATR